MPRTLNFMPWSLRLAWETPAGWTGFVKPRPQPRANGRKRSRNTGSHSISGVPPGTSSAAEKLEAATVYHLAAKAYGLALGASDRGHTKELSAAARAGLARCNEELGHGSEETPHDSMAPKLTRREWDIVNLAVQGLSDRQIADTLLISVRTVEGHLYRCYSKLGITGRDELAGAAAVAQGASGTN